MGLNKQKGKYWWLREDCRECRFYPDCDFIETKSKIPRGCSLYKVKPKDNLKRIVK